MKIILKQIYRSKCKQEIILQGVTCAERGSGLICALVTHFKTT